MSLSLYELKQNEPVIKSEFLADKIKSLEERIVKDTIIQAINSYEGESPSSYNIRIKRLVEMVVFEYGTHNSSYISSSKEKAELFLDEFLRFAENNYKIGFSETETEMLKKCPATIMNWLVDRLPIEFLP
jgi:hypothetical protein